MKTSAQVGHSKIESVTPVPIIRAETNFLRFPLFALGSKNLSQIDFREVKGQRKTTDRDGEVREVDFCYRVSRNTAHQFPGPMARKIHFALLSLLYKQSHPYQNPIRFSWRQLANEMGISYAGSKTTNAMRDAISAIHGVIITTEHAFIDGGTRNTIKRKRGLHVYEEFVFKSELSSDGRVADSNQVWLADWYLENLNAFYSTPLNYDLWRELNEQSTIASRLYEYLTFLFGKGSLRQIRYSKLARSLPIEEMRYESDCIRQFQKPLKLLVDREILKEFHWKKGIHNDLILSLKRGKNLKFSSTLVNEENLVSISKTIDGQFENGSAAEVVKQFYQHRFGISEHVATKSEIEFVDQLVNQYGVDTILSVTRKAAARLKAEFPNGQSIKSAQLIFEQLSEKSLNQKSEPTNIEKEKLESKSERKQKRELLKRNWEQLPEEQKQVIEKTIQTRHPNFELGSEKFLRSCYFELSHQLRSSSSSES